MGDSIKERVNYPTSIPLYEYDGFCLPQYIGRFDGYPNRIYRLFQHDICCRLTLIDVRIEIFGLFSSPFPSPEKV